MRHRPLWPAPDAAPQVNVTGLLERVVGEPVRVQLLHQQVIQAGHPPKTDDGLWARGEELLNRTVLLRGKLTGRAYLYAVSNIAVKQLPVSVFGGLYSSDV